MSSKKRKCTAEELGVDKVHLESGIEVNPIYTSHDIDDLSIKNINSSRKLVSGYSMRLFRKASMADL